jgi:hypothetical protein
MMSGEVGGVEQVVDRILDIEEKMFLSVPTGDEPACRSRIAEMRLHRRSQFAGWSPSTVRSYLGDLETADREGRNLFTAKYARMENLIPALSMDPCIPEILDVFIGWQKIMLRDYPNVMRGGRDIEGFRRYLSAELETYSPGTRAKLLSDVRQYQVSGGSITREVYETMARLAGYSSLDDMEMTFSDRKIP